MEEERQDSPLIHVMAHELMQRLCEILDAGDIWVELAPLMPDITAADVECCRKYADQGSSSRFLLRVWASKGYSILDLYNLFAIARLVRCMQLIRSEVPQQYHYLETYYAPNTEEETPKPHSVTSKSHQATGGGSSSRSHLSARASGMSTSTVGQSNSAASLASDASLFNGLKNTPPAPYGELMAATNNFSPSNIIGKGGYGVVYRGEWKQLDVAIKRLLAEGRGVGIKATVEDQKIRVGKEVFGPETRQEKERLRQSLQELNILARFRHDNIIPVYAYSLDGNEPCLVYQFMANGSLDDRLQCKKGSRPLTWPEKGRIARGTASALFYLHSISRCPVIHGDVKTANILLDRHMEAKLGDFGLSRQGQVEMDTEEKGVLIASHIKGTLAYLPPEFINTKILSTKLDVYSFGIVLLEIATGLRAFVDSRKPQNLVDFCEEINLKLLSSPVLFEMWSDKRTPLDEAVRTEVFDKLWSLGLRCAERDRLARPNSNDVLSQLRGFD